MGFNGMAEALRSITDRLSLLSEAETQPSIYKVHKPLRDVNEKAYEPEIVAIGPYHHGKDNLQMMEERKVRYLESLLQSKTEIFEKYIKIVAEMEHVARDCYAESINLSSAEFIEMLVLDGCFIIELIRKCCSGDSTCTDNDPIIQTRWIMNSLQRDLILFENQIPFFVLSKLFDLTEGPNNHERLIDLILLFFQNLYPEAGYRKKTKRSSYEVKHLLDLVHYNWLPSPDVHIKVEALPIERGFRSIHSATELTDANVRFRKKECDSLFEVEFKNGIMLLPPLTIGDRTECFFRNLIAYEQYFPNDQRTFVIDYVRLMSCLITSSRDVEILSQHGIIDNWLGDSKVVANIFNQLADSVTCPANHFVYAETFRLINTHYMKRWNRATAVLKRDYFHSPWAYISFAAALLLLLLTVAQSVFSALQVV